MFHIFHIFSILYRVQDIKCVQFTAYHKFGLRKHNTGSTVIIEWQSSNVMDIAFIYFILYGNIKSKILIIIF